MNLERWSRLMSNWGFGQHPETYDQLVSFYSQKHRHYHTLEHIAACLKHVDTCVAQMKNPREVELALWFHDAIYEPLSAKNELKSAEWATSFLLANGTDADTVSRIYRLIMATTHDAPIQTQDESILVDIDLSILGADPHTYDSFEKAIRAEYKSVPLFIYKRKRAAVLRGFLERDRIYRHEPFFTEREQQARRNLAKAVDNL